MYGGKRQKRDQLLRKAEEVKAIKSLAMPDQEVKLKLRLMGHPICYFGENPGRRLERLKEKIKLYYRAHNSLPKWMADAQKETNRHSSKGSLEDVSGHLTSKSKKNLKLGPEDPEVFRFREKLVQESLKKAKNRTQGQKERCEKLDPLELEQKVLNEISGYRFFSFSQCHFADSSSVSRGSLSFSGKNYATSGFSGDIKLWNPIQGEEIGLLKGHIGQVIDLAYSPSDEGILASSGLDNSVRIWKEGKDVILGGHKDRVNRLGFGLGPWLVSCSHDKTVRIWDIDQCKSIMALSGHSAEVYTTGFHPDGAIVVKN